MNCRFKQVQTCVYCQLDSEFFWFWEFRETMWWTDSLAHFCGMKQVKTCTASFIQKFSDFGISWKYLVNSSLILSCGSKSKLVLPAWFRNFLIASLGFSWKFMVNSSFIQNLSNWFIWCFRENMWWHIHWFIVELSKSKLVLPAWFRNFSDCFLPIWRAFVVVYVLLLHQAITVDHLANNHQIIYTKDSFHLQQYPEIRSP